MSKILVVEDESLVAQMIQRMAENAGLQVETANNGAEGIKKAKELKPDLILMDIMMPELDGLSALMQLKKDPETEKIPVVMLTNLSGKHDEELAINEGATLFVTKQDFNPKFFEEKIVSILKK